MKRSVVLTMPHFQSAILIGQAAEEAGYYRAWMTETKGRDAIVRAAALGSVTSRIAIGTGIAYAFTRTPMVMAAATNDVQGACAGRFTLGLGAGTRGLRRRYGVDWERPAPQFVDYTRLLRTLLAADGDVNYGGDFYQLKLPDYVAPSLARGTQIYGSGVNRVMLKYCAMACDGVAVHAVAAAPGYLEDVTIPAINAGSERAGRSVRVACWCIASVAHDEDEARERARHQLAFYFSTPSYGAVAELGGWPEVARRVREKAKEVNYLDWAVVAREVPDELVDDLTVSGTTEQVRSRLPAVEARFHAAGADEVAYQLVGMGLSPEANTVAGLLLVEACAPTPGGAVVHPSCDG